MLEAMPVLATGKLDRRSLPAFERTSWRPKTFELPRDPLEQQLVMIWEKVLGTSPIAVTDNFFDLGGHSLLAARKFAEIQRGWAGIFPWRPSSGRPRSSSLRRS